MSAAAVPFADLSLARRLERAEAASCAGFAEARARLFPDSGARWIEVPRSAARRRTTRSARLPIRRCCRC